MGDLTNAEYANLQSLLSDPKNLPYLFLGCQGPDFLFFNTKDMNPTLGKFVEYYFEVYDFIENFKRTLLEAVPQPVLDALEAFDEAVDEVIEDSALLSEIQQTFDDLNQLLDGFVGTLTVMVKKFISDFNLFDIISHPYRDGVASDEKWWWFDALHYRKTGKYAKALLDLSSASKPEHLYAIGYITHFAADTVGHPYVNIVSGGPYRSHAQRHKTSENFQDVFNYLNETLDDFNRSKLHTAQVNLNIIAQSSTYTFNLVHLPNANEIISFKPMTQEQVMALRHPLLADFRISTKLSTGIIRKLKITPLGKTDTKLQIKQEETGFGLTIRGVEGIDINKQAEINKALINALQAINKGRAKTTEFKELFKSYREMNKPIKNTSFKMNIPNLGLVKGEATGLQIENTNLITGRTRGGITLIITG